MNRLKGELGKCSTGRQAVVSSFGPHFSEEAPLVGSVNTHLNVMAQYHHCFRAFDIPELARSISREEFVAAIETARSYGLHRLDRIEPRPFAGVL